MANATSTTHDESVEHDRANRDGVSSEITAGSDSINAIQTASKLTPDVPQSHSTRASPHQLHILTGIDNLRSNTHQITPTIAEPSFTVQTRAEATGSTVPESAITLRGNLSASSMTSVGSPASLLISPYLSAMGEITPLPSPIVGPDTPNIWRQAIAGALPSRSRTSSLDSSANRHAISRTRSPSSPTKRKKAYGGLAQDARRGISLVNQERRPRTAGGAETSPSRQHERNRSISAFVPEPLQNVQQRHVTLGSSISPSDDSQYHMHREICLADGRGVKAVQSEQQLPTPPPSNSSAIDVDETEDQRPHLIDGTATDYLDIHCGIHNKARRFTQLRKLGQGTFSTVMLATRQRISTRPSSEIERSLDPHKLVAVKIVEHGPAGGADQERIEVGLHREIEILKSIAHPSLIHLKAFETQEHRTLLSLTYCPGGDLFELASEHRDLLSPLLVQRIFSELIDAVQYLHNQWIVHRDIKLENVLVNLRPGDLKAMEDPTTSLHALVTLTDLGLSRRIPEPPESPLLTTRCGSEDYAAPEILLGVPYDGRQTDAWALGVLLYALMEGRLPFDAPPGKQDRSRNTHRIARCEWIWCRFGDRFGDWDASKAQGFEGAHECVEGLLKKVRMGRKPLGEIAQLEWVKNGIRSEGGSILRPGDDDDEDDGQDSDETSV